MRHAWRGTRGEARVAKVRSQATKPRRETHESERNSDRDLTFPSRRDSAWHRGPRDTIQTHLQMAEGANSRWWRDC